MGFNMRGVRFVELHKNICCKGAVVIKDNKNRRKSTCVQPRKSSKSAIY